MNDPVTNTSYDRIGLGYVRFADPTREIEARIMSALDDARTVVNVGAGTGSYEPADRVVVAVEPSEGRNESSNDLQVQHRASGQPLSAYRFSIRASMRRWAS